LRPLGSIFSGQDYPNLLVGIEEPDDAAVWKIDDVRSIVVTMDFFTPVVDDPYDYGSIAAANSISDIYAMGATPFLALNIAALPPQLSADFLSEITRGAAEKAKEAGAIIAGGHTIQDKEPKFGLVVIGMAESEKIMKKSSVQLGDELILTKPLGMGVTSTANKADKAKPEDIDEAITWMKMLNKNASEIGVKVGIKAATDITGFSLLGHAYEMAKSSNVGIELDSKKIPFLAGARFYGEKWYFAGGAADNKLFYEQFIKFSSEIDEVTEMLLFDPQTSGGLLMACPPEKLPEFDELAKESNMPYWIIGKAFAGSGIVVK
jgi:selenide,water dikinase